jgi:hypothetical protein
VREVLRELVCNLIGPLVKSVQCCALSPSRPMGLHTRFLQIVVYNRVGLHMRLRAKATK